MSVLAPVSGFRFAGIACGIKKEQRLDLGAIVADAACPVAAVLTRNRVRAAPVDLCAQRLGAPHARAFLVNSGNANAATGDEGRAAAERAVEAFARAADLAPEQVLPASTGVIGVVLPDAKIVAAAPTLVASLEPHGVESFSKAILTTDRGPKVSRRTFTSNGASHQVLAIAKGAGMIHPDMATTLAFVVTDARMDATTLRAALRRATDHTFNRITVDGDTSTNDCILAMASGERGEAASGDFEQALADALGEVAQMIVADGEGAEHVARIVVRGTANDAEALRIARTIATSPLVKTAMHGCDPNWGRILAAAGRAGVDFSVAATSVCIGETAVFESGRAAMTPDRESAASQTMSQPLYEILVEVGAGPGNAHYLTCDLGHPYVTLNADYRS